MANITIYRSGSGSVSDLHGYMLSGVPVGLPCVRVSKGKLVYLSEKVEYEMIQYARAGYRVFIDSGAFSVFQHNLQNDALLQLDFDAIFERYFRYSVVGNTSIAMVMPDVIGNQKATLDLQARYKEKIRTLIEKGIDVIIPIQKGELNPAQCWKAVKDIAGSNNVRVAIPSNKEAFSAVDLVELLCVEDPPQRLHLLGLTHANRKFSEKIGKILEYAPNVDISCDGNRLRAMLGKTRKVTQTQNRLEAEFKEIIDDNSILDDYIETDNWMLIQDGLSRNLTADQTLEVAEALGVYDYPEDEMIAAGTEGLLLSWIESNYPGFGEYPENDLFKVVFSWTSREQISAKFKDADHFFKEYVFCDVPAGVSRIAAIAAHAVESMPRISIQQNLFSFLGQTQKQPA